MDQVIFLDLETTALNAFAVDGKNAGGICEIGAIFTSHDDMKELSEYGVVDETFRSFHCDVNPRIVRPGKPIPDGLPNAGTMKGINIEAAALKVNGFTRDRINQGWPLYRAISQFSAQVKERRGKALLAGWNIQFDVTFLKQAYVDTHHDFNALFDYHILDFWAIAQGLQYSGLIPMDVKLSLQTFADYLGVPKTPAHTALGDAQRTMMVAVRLLHMTRHHDVLMADDRLTGAARILANENWEPKADNPEDYVTMLPGQHLAQWAVGMEPTGETDNEVWTDPDVETPQPSDDDSQLNLPIE